jgi:phage N-6-adenine-methyltransferase
MPVFDSEKIFDKEKVALSEKSIEWEAPPEIFEPLHKEFGFTLDVCANIQNTKCERYFDLETDGLSKEWKGVCWMNPPYGRTVKHWIKKALDEADRGNATTVCLIPAKTNTNWWWDYILACKFCEVRWVRGRVKFIKDGVQTKQALPWSLAIIIFRARG